MISTPKKFWRVFIYGTLGTACIISLIAALTIPDWQNLAEAQIAAVYLALLIGSQKGFNAKPFLGHQMPSSIAMFTTTGILPAAIIHVAIAELTPGQPDHLGTLAGHSMVILRIAIAIAFIALIPVKIWEAYEEKRGKTERTEP